MTDLFKEKAKEWDINEMVQALSSAVGDAILEHVPLNDGMRVMDFGAGTGLISSQIAPKVKRITAVDTSEAMLEKLATKEELKGRVEILCRNITRQPLDEKFDLIMSAMALHHVEDTERLVESFVRHLNPGGQIALADLDMEDGTFHPDDIQGVYHHGFDRGVLQGMLERHSFYDIRFFTAHRVVKGEKSYTVFLVIAKTIDNG